MARTGPMPDLDAEISLSVRGEDPAAHEDVDIDPDDVIPELGEVQRKILMALRDVTLGDETIWREQKGWVKYGIVPNAVVEYGYVGSSENAHRAAVSRAVRSLLERKLVCGAAKKWHRFYGVHETASEPNSDLSYGAKPWDGLKEDRASDGVKRPRLAYVRLTTRGHAVAAALSDE